MTIFIAKNVRDIITGYFVYTGFKTKMDNGIRELKIKYSEIRAWFPTLEEALSYAQMLLLKRYYDDYDEIKYLGENELKEIGEEKK